jgi:hypothetical protein
MTTDIAIAETVLCLDPKTRTVRRFSISVGRKRCGNWYAQIDLGDHRIEAGAKDRATAVTEVAEFLIDELFPGTRKCAACGCTTESGCCPDCESEANADDYGDN